MPLTLILRLLPYLLGAALAGVAWWYVDDLRTEKARLERDLSEATNRASLVDKAYRAIDTYRRQENETRDKYEAINERLTVERAQAAADRAAADTRRVRDLAAARAAFAARGGRLPEAPADGRGGIGADPIGLLLAIVDEADEDAAVADATAARLGRCYDRRRADRGLMP